MKSIKTISDLNEHGKVLIGNLPPTGVHSKDGTLFYYLLYVVHEEGQAPLYYWFFEPVTDRSIWAIRKAKGFDNIPDQDASEALNESISDGDFKRFFDTKKLKVYQINLHKSVAAGFALEWCN